MENCFGPASALLIVLRAMASGKQLKYEYIVQGYPGTSHHRKGYRYFLDKTMVAKSTVQSPIDKGMIVQDGTRFELSTQARAILEQNNSAGE